MIKQTNKEREFGEKQPPISYFIFHHFTKTMGKKIKIVTFSSHNSDFFSIQNGKEIYKFTIIIITLFYFLFHCRKKSCNSKQRKVRIFSEKFIFNSDFRVGFSLTFVQEDLRSNECGLYFKKQNLCFHMISVLLDSRNGRSREDEVEGGPQRLILPQKSNIHVLYNCSLIRKLL